MLATSKHCLTSTQGKQLVAGSPATECEPELLLLHCASHCAPVQHDMMQVHFCYDGREIKTFEAPKQHKQGRACENKAAPVDTSCSWPALVSSQHFQAGLVCSVHCSGPPGQCCSALVSCLQDVPSQMCGSLLLF